MLLSTPVVSFLFKAKLVLRLCPVFSAFDYFSSFPSSCIAIENSVDIRLKHNSCLVIRIIKLNH